jgi:Fimbrillin-like
MKKLIYAATTLAIVFSTSCSQNEVLEQISGTPINFRNSYLTKAAASGAFNVLGYTGSSDTKFMEDTYTIGGAFGSGNTYYFDGEAASSYKFYAYALNAANALSTFTPASTSVATTPPSITFATDASASQDLVIASDVTIKGNQSNAVALSFKHALTKVRFTVQKATGVGNKIDVTKIVYTVNNSSATFSLADGVASSLASGTNNIYTLTGNATTNITTTAVEFPDASTFLYVIPQTLTTGATLAVTYKIDGVEQTPASFDLSNTLGQNKQVVYAITVTPNTSAISFSATVGDWEAETTSTL